MKFKLLVKVYCNNIFSSYYFNCKINQIFHDMHKLLWKIFYNAE